MNKDHNNPDDQLILKNLRTLKRMKSTSIFYITLIILGVIGVLIGKFIPQETTYFLIWIGGIGIVIGNIAGFVNSIIILVTHWSDPKIEKIKVMWGVLGILLLGSLATLIFCVRARISYRHY